MSRIHPTHGKKTRVNPPGDDHGLSVLTVWKKSSMAFQGSDGFSVFDRKGRLVFRVENYSRRSRCFTEKIVLMDGEGKPLLHLRPQKFSVHDEWYGFEGAGEGKPQANRSSVFAMRRQSLLKSGDRAVIFMGKSRNTTLAPDYHIEGCFRRRNCKILSGSSQVVAEVSRKKAKSTIILNEDVFNLVVHQGVDCELIMAFIVIMDRICLKAYVPALCTQLYQ